MQVSERKRRGNPALGAMAAEPPDISGYLKSQGFGTRELATLEVTDSAAVAAQLSFELNVPHSDELAKAVKDLIAAAKDEDRLLQRTGGLLASDLAWTQLSSSSSMPARPWLEAKVTATQRSSLAALSSPFSRSFLIFSPGGGFSSGLQVLCGHANWEKSWPL